MKRLSLISLTLSFALGASMLFCNLPQNPAENPRYADIELSIDNVMIHQGDVPQIGVMLYFTQHFQTASLTTSCYIFDTTFSTDSLKMYDTVYFNPQFNIPGPCTLFVSAQYKDSGLRDKCDTLPLYILAKETGVYFIKKQTPVTTVTGKTDTLLFITRASSGTILPPEYKISALPAAGITLTPLYSQQKDTVRVVTVASVADTFTIMVAASALYGNSLTIDSALTGIRVNAAGTASEDTTKPQLSLIDPALDGKKISSSQITVNCIAKDSESGIENVSITCGSTTTLAVLQQDSIYSGIVSGLQNGKPTEITITAIDKSMRKNVSVLKFAVTYDSTIPGVAPEITTPLPATAQVIEGTTLSLKIIASGMTAPTYQWYKDNVLKTGQISAEFSKDSVTAADSGSYYVVVSNGVGNSVTSTKTVVAIRLRAKITQDPIATTVNEGGSGSFTVMAAGEEPLAYQWLKNGELITGATSPTYSITSADPVDNNKNFTCIVSNAVNKDTSTAGILTFTTKPVYQVSFEAGDGVAAPASQQTAEGGKITQPAAPSRNGYDFSGWYKDAATTYAWNFITDVVSGPVTLYAKWSLKSYTITYNLNSGSNGNNPTRFTIISARITFAEAARTGYTFAGWYDNDELTGTAVTTIPLGSTGNKVLWAKWIRKSTSTFTLTIIATNGSVTKYPDTTVYDSGTVLILTPVPAVGYQFTGWSGELSGTTAPVLIAMDTVKSVTANFAKIPCALTMANDGHGTTTPVTGTSNVSYGDSILISATAKTGYNFTRWSISPASAATIVSPVSASTKVILTNAATITANFQLNTYELTISNNGNGTTTPPSIITVNHGTSTLISAMPNTGYKFAKWVVTSGVAIIASDTSASSTVTLSSCDATIKAFFSGRMVDNDGNVYTTVVIGSQEWSVENLRTTKYNNGDTIPYVTDSATWSNLSTPGFCFYNNNTTVSEREKWGALYNWYAVNTGKLAPSGWRVTEDADWTKLVVYLIANGYNYDGRTTGDNVGKSLAAKTDWSTSDNTGAIGNDLTKNNASGFSALPGGYRYSTGFFSGQNNVFSLWNTTEYNALNANHYALYSISASQGRGNNSKGCGYSVRLVRDLN